MMTIGVVMEELWMLGSLLVLQAFLLPFLLLLCEDHPIKRTPPLPYPKWPEGDYPYFQWSESKKELYRRKRKPIETKAVPPADKVPVKDAAPKPVEHEQPEPAPVPLKPEIIYVDSPAKPSSAELVQTDITLTMPLHFKPLVVAPEPPPVAVPEEVYENAEEPSPAPVPVPVVSPVEVTQDEPTEVTQEESPTTIVHGPKRKPGEVYVGGKLVGGGHNREIVVMSGPINWTKKGGMQKVKLVNVSGFRQAIKVKCSDNGMFRVNPVLAFIEKDSEIDLSVYRAHGQPKADQLVILNTLAEEKDTDPGSLFSKPSFFSSTLTAAR